jgi:hypothetical protein
MKLPYKKLIDDEKDSDLNRIQANIMQALQTATANLLDDAVLLSGVSLVAATATLVAHKLGRVPQGFLVAGASASANIWQSPSGAPQTYLKLLTTQDVIVNLIVF